MPSEHRKFLTEVGQLPALREYVDGRSNNERLRVVYNGCLKALSDWRRRHIGVVTTHIVTPARKQQPNEQQLNAEEVTDCLSVKDESALKGTGGSALIPFLKQAKQETVECHI